MRSLVLSAFPGSWFLLIATAAASETSLRHEAVIDASVDEVWKAFTTNEGIESWMAAGGDIDLRVGGKMRSTYEKTATLGDGTTIENTILSFEPRRMLSMQATKAPDSFPFKNAIAGMWSVVYMEPLAAQKSKVTIVGMGFGTDDESQKMRQFFDQGNALTLRKLQEKFAGRGSNDAAERTLAKLRGLVGGEWISENNSDNGAVFRVRNLVEAGPDGKSLVCKGWLGDAGGMFFHGATLIWRDPSSRTVRFINLNEQGAVASGAIELDAEDHLVWDWQVSSENGRKASYLVDMHFEGADQYRMRLFEAQGTQRKEAVNVECKRVSQVPERFQKLKAPAGTSTGK